MCFDAAPKYQAGAFAHDIARINERMSNFQARDALERGEETGLRIGEAASQLAGSQRAGLAAQNALVDAGTAAEIQADTRRLASYEITEAQNNAWREAWGYKAQASIFDFEGHVARLQGASAASGAVLGGAYEYAQSAQRSFSAVPEGRGDFQRSHQRLGG
jgi:hypothetical protein